MERRTKSEQKMLVALSKAVSTRMEELQDAGTVCNFESISKAAGVSSVTVARLVRKKEGLNIITVMRIFNSLGISAAEVLRQFEGA